MTKYVVIRTRYQSDCEGSIVEEAFGFATLEAAESFKTAQVLPEGKTYTIEYWIKEVQYPTQEG